MEDEFPDLKGADFFSGFSAIILVFVGV